MSLSFFLFLSLPFFGVQTQRLGPKVRAREARFGLELDWEKLWRGQVFGGQVQERLMLQV